MTSLPRPRSKRPVDCERCQHFAGRTSWAGVEFACEKGHTADSTVTLLRHGGCDDYKAAGRDSLIFRRFRGQAEWHGDESLKNRQAAVRRTASSLAKSLSEFGDMLDSQQVQAGRDAVAALHRLGDDIERAASLAKAYKAKKDKERAEAEQRKADDLAARLMPGWSAEDVAACAEDLLHLCDTKEGQRWLHERRGRDVMTESGVFTLREDVQAWRRAAPASQQATRLAALRRNLAGHLFALERPTARYYATLDDFKAYRTWRRGQLAAKTSVAALLAEAERQAGEGNSDAAGD